jgi:hypothetical protein
MELNPFLKYNTLMLKELVLAVCNVVKGMLLCGFSGPRNYSGTLLPQVLVLMFQHKR